jgi:hypothetical protein
MRNKRSDRQKWSALLFISLVASRQARHPVPGNATTAARSILQRVSERLGYFRVVTG